MILTEEQRAALKRVVAYMDEMYAIASPYHGCTEDANILRAMIDSSEHFSDATKMIGFDLERARASIAHYRIENPSNVDTESALKELVDQANLAEDALAEIERLQGFETAARDLNNDLIRIAGERDELAARIQELEDAHKRSGVKYAKIINELRSSVYANIPGLKKQWDEILNTPANDKIGPSEEQIRAKMAELPSTPGPYRPAIREEAIRQLDVKPRSRQITEERKAAIRDAEIALRDAVLDSNDPHCWDAETAVLRGMLEEVA